MLKSKIPVLLALFALALAQPATAAQSTGLNYLVGTWSCTYRAGTMSMPYRSTFAYDRGGQTLRQLATFAGGGDEELFGYDAKRGGWSAVVFDHGVATVMQGAGSDPNHIAFHSVYPDASIAETFDRITATEYTLHATVRSGGKTTASVDTCVRGGA